MCPAHLPAPSQWLLLLLLLLLLQRTAPHRVQQPQQQPQQQVRGPAVYDVEVREVDSSQLGQLLRNVPRQQVFVQGGPNQALHPLRQHGQDGQDQQWFEQLQRGGMGPGTGPSTGPGHQWHTQRLPAPGGSTGHTQAQFVAPSGQVYSLKNMDGKMVLVGPDGRWYPLNGGAGPGMATQQQPQQQPQHQGFHRDGGAVPPAPTEPPQWLSNGPKHSGEDGGPPYYDIGSGGGGGGQKDIRQAQDCVASQTTYNGGKSACRYQLLFEDTFHVLNLSQWQHDVLMPAEPDFEFVAYDSDPDNSYVSDGLLFLKPTILEDSFKPGFVMNGTLTLNGCTSPRRDLCSRTAHTYRVLPAVRSARITTRQTFSFRYGIVEARVLIPQGDWIYPAFTLEPAKQTYGRWYAGGQIRMPMALGNRWLSERNNGPRTGLQLLRAGVALGLRPGEEFTPTVMESTKRAEKGTNWRKEHFRVYRVKWTPDAIEFSLDGKPMGKIEPPPGGFVTLTDKPATHPWRQGSDMAPFDQEFFLSLAVGVGGVNRFPDNSTNGEYNEHPKPWKNSSPKALLDFWKARDFWVPTWQHPAMEVDYVRVWAL